MGDHQHMIRILRLSDTSDHWLVRSGDEVTLEVPGGRVTLKLTGGWSESGIAFCHLGFEPIRQGLTRLPPPPRPDYIAHEVLGGRVPVRRRFLPGGRS